MIAIAGIPGSGKTTVAKLLVARLNERARLSAADHDTATGDVAVHVPMDGFHYTRSYLRSMPDPEEAVARRGAAFTFDAEGYASLVKQIRTAPVTTTDATAATVSSADKSSHPPAVDVLAPSFDHGVKDPVPGAIRIATHHRIVALEGLYVALADTPETRHEEELEQLRRCTHEGKVRRDAGLQHWEEASALVDERWLVRVDRDLAVARLARRHVKSGIVAGTADGGDEAVANAYLRATTNDMPNGDWLLKRLASIDEVVESFDDESVVREADAVDMSM